MPDCYRSLLVSCVGKQGVASSVKKQSGVASAADVAVLVLQGTYDDRAIGFYLVVEAVVSNGIKASNSLLLDSS